MSPRLSADLLLRALAEPTQFLRYTPLQREGVVRFAERANLLAAVAARLPDEPLPSDLRDRLEGATIVAAEHARKLRWELAQLAPVVAGLNVPIVVLKGGAYLCSGLATAQGRMVSDLDLLVAERDLARVEAAMRAAGYQSLSQDAYEESYYRQWMHEVPPLIHPARGTVVDLHHNIAPPVSRVRIDAALLLADAQPLAGPPGYRRLSDPDMVLHLCVHLFHDGELDNGLRELLDLDGMLRAFASAVGFWDRLLARARLLGVERPLYYGIANCRRILDTPLPAAFWAVVRQAAPPEPARRLMLALMRSALLPEQAARPSVTRSLVVQLLFLRAHWLRMPPGMLVRHLLTQVRRRGGFKTKEAAARGAR